MQKRVLIVSISSLNESVGSNTWKELLSFCEEDEVACITFRPGCPEKHFSKNYLIYNENQIVKSVFNRKIVPCSKFNPKTYIEEKHLDLYKHKKHFVFLKRIIREIIWSISKWKNSALNSFINEFNPTHVVYFMDGYIHANRICRYIKKTKNVKSVGYFVDDTFTYRQYRLPLFFVLRFFQRRSLRKLVKNTDYFWAINEEIKKEADTFFKINCDLITKPLRQSIILKETKSLSLPIKFLYAGNLNIGRNHTLRLLDKEISKINGGETIFSIDVYSNSTIKRGHFSKFTSFHGPIPQEKVFELQQTADVLLFLESVRKRERNIARLSFSTKIVDYLSIKKPILAIGSKSTFPMNYFFNAKAAICCFSKKDINDRLTELKNNPLMAEFYANNSFNLGKMNHDRETILKKVRKYFEE